MSFLNERNIKYMLLISLCLFALYILFYIVTSKLKEGLDNSEGLVDFTNADPNIKPEPLPDFCIGNGNFISQPNSTVPLVATAGYLHSNIGACEDECTPERGCFAVSFDRASKDVMKKCNIYSGASSTSADTIKAGTVCSRTSPRCSVDGYKLNNTSKSLVKTIKPPHGTYFTHTSESSCANECNSRPNCVGYLYNNSSKKHWKPCRIFSKNSSGASTGFPVAGICSRDKASASLYNGTWQGNHSNTCWHSSYKTNKLVLKANGNKITITPLDPKMLAQYGVGNVEMDGYKLTGDWKYFGKDGFFTLDGNRLYWMGYHYCWYEKISDSTYIPSTLPTSHSSDSSTSSGKCQVNNYAIIAAFGENSGSVGVSGMYNPICSAQKTKDKCVPINSSCPACCQWVPTPSSKPHTPTTSPSGLAGNWHQVGVPASKVITIQDDGQIDGKPKITGTGSGMPWGGGWGFLNTPDTMFFKFGNQVTLPAALVGKNSSGQFTKIAFNNGAVWTRVTSSSSSPPPHSSPSGLDGKWHQVGESDEAGAITLHDAGKINGKLKITGSGAGVVGGSGWGFLNTPDTMFFQFGNGITLPAALVDKNSSGQFTKIAFNNGAIWTRVASSSHHTHPTHHTHHTHTTHHTHHKDHIKKKLIDQVVNPIIGTGAWQSPLPVAQ